MRLSNRCRWGVRFSFDDNPRMSLLIGDSLRFHTRRDARDYARRSFPGVAFTIVDHKGGRQPYLSWRKWLRTRYGSRWNTPRSVGEVGVW